VPQDTPPSVRAFAERVNEALTAAGLPVVSTILHGSAALGSWVSATSDVDVMVIADDTRRIGGQVLSRCASAVHGLASTCPGRGAELSVITAGLARRPAPPWPFLLHVNTEPTHMTTVFGQGHPGDPDLLLHLAVCRAVGIGVRGAAPADIIGEIDRASIIRAMDAELVSSLDDADTTYTVLNACRAWCYVVTDRLVSKRVGAKWAVTQGASRPTIDRALAARIGESDPPTQAAAATLVERARAALAGAQTDPGTGESTPQ
jgi:streptomycin 3"-adenylyltransferase